MHAGTCLHIFEQEWEFCQFLDESTSRHTLQEMSDASDLDGEEEVDREVEVLGARCFQLCRALLPLWQQYFAKRTPGGLKDLIISQDPTGALGKPRLVTFYSAGARSAGSVLYRKLGWSS